MLHYVSSRLVAFLTSCMPLHKHLTYFFLLLAASPFILFLFFSNVPVVSCFVFSSDYLNPFGFYTATTTLQAASFWSTNLRSICRNMNLLLLTCDSLVSLWHAVRCPAPFPACDWFQHYEQSLWNECISKIFYHIHSLNSASFLVRLWRQSPTLA
jgi:hypothetical protein